jgi:4-hydroxy-2-oxoglutarate aldolase
MTNRPSLAGIIPPVATPFAPDGDLALDKLQANLSRLNGEPLAGYVLGGSNGEFSSLTVEERLEVVAAAREVTPRDRLLIAGSGLESTRGTIALTERVARLGADVAIVVTPGYFRAKMTAEALEAHFVAVADAAPIPVLLYSVPANTSVDLPAAAVARLARHPNVLGLKDSGGDITKIGQMVHDTPDEFQILAGSAGFLLAALAVGAVGGVMALANIAGRQLYELYARFQAGDLAGARAAQLPLIALNSAVTARFGVAGLKAAMEMLGYHGGAPRAPLLPLASSDRATLQRLVAEAGLGL